MSVAHGRWAGQTRRLTGSTNPRTRHHVRAQVRPGLRRSAPTATGWIYVGLGDGGFASRCLRTRQARSGAARSCCARWLEWLVAPGADAVVAAIFVPALGYQPGALG